MTTVPEQVEQVAHLFFMDDRLPKGYVTGQMRDTTEQQWKDVADTVKDDYRQRAYPHVRAYNLLTELDAPGRPY